MKMFKQFSIAILAVVCMAFAGLVEQADSQARHLTAQNIGLGGGGTAYQDLYHANFVNPANLMINHDRRPSVTVGIAGGIYSNVGGSLVNISTYNEYLTTGQVIEGAMADDMLDQWFGAESSGMRSFSADVGVVPIGFSLRAGNWSVSAASRVRVLGNSGYSRGFADLVFRGLDSDTFNEARAVNMNQEFLAYNEISVGFAMTVFKADRFFGFAENVRLHVGAAPKLLMAINYARLNLDSSLQIQSATSSQNASINHDFRYTFETTGQISDQLSQYNTLRQNGSDPKLGEFFNPTADDFTGFKGTSLGLDMGATLEMDINKLPLFSGGFFRGDKKLRVGLSLTDLGAVSINDRTRSFTAADNFVWDGIYYDPETIDEEFDGDDGKYFESVLRDSVGNDVYGNFQTREESGFSKGLPTMINFGSHLLLGKFSFMVDVGTGFVERGANSGDLHLSLGTEYRLLNKIPLRVGYRTGGYTSTTYHAGTGIEFKNFEFSFGVASSTNSSKNGAGLGAAWSGLVVHF